MGAVATKSNGSDRYFFAPRCQGGNGSTARKYSEADYLAALRCAVAKIHYYQRTRLDYHPMDCV